MYVAVMGWDGSRGTGCIVGHHLSVNNTDTFTVRVLTCAHAVCLQLPVQVYGIRISGPSGQTGRVVLMDPGLDLALVELSVDSTASILNFQWLPTTADGASDGQLFGQPVLAFGFPTDSYNLCTGLVSCPAGQRFAEENYRHFAASRNVDLTSQHLHYPIPDQQSIMGGQRQYPADGTFNIEHTAQTESGYSGGPLIDADSGQLLGINHSIGVNITFASSSNYINDLLDKADICKDRQFQRRRLEHRPIRLGYEFAYYFDSCSLTDKIIDTDGNASLEPTDEIVELNGQLIESLDHFIQLLDQCPDNQPISLTVLSIEDSQLSQPTKTVRLMPTNGLTSV
ncbi:uncharacterized protein LOC128956583 [Oppia nitens]|uniref:uncharacterized protein LOC128956583 n=1 Tax=Oppia nitens TaxID=1686743 RepID=UPI0023D9873A|nr:uncharacterized protein LOC128956583 [Oppia nitens]